MKGAVKGFPVIEAVIITILKIEDIRTTITAMAVVIRAIMKTEETIGIKTIITITIEEVTEMITIIVIMMKTAMIQTVGARIMVKTGIV